MKKIMIYFVILIIFLSSFEKSLIDFYRNSDIDGLMSLLDTLKKKDKGISSSLYYYIAEITTDKELSLKYYKTIVEKYKDLPFYSHSLLRLAKYNTLISDTTTALSYYRNILSSKDSLVVEYGYAGLIGIYENYANMDAANYWISNYLDQFPSGIFSKYLKKNQEKEHSYVKEKYYSIQIGSFKSMENAENQFKTFKNKSYDVFLVKEKEFYKVRIGKFKTENDARNFLKVFQKAEAIPAWIVYGE